MSQIFDEFQRAYPTLAKPECLRSVHFRRSSRIGEEDMLSFYFNEGEMFDPIRAEARVVVPASGESGFRRALEGRPNAS